MRRLYILLLLLAAACPLGRAAIPEKLVPEFSTSTTTSVNHDMHKSSTFSLSSMDADWRNPGKGWSGQISYDVVAKHFMGLNVAYRFTPWLQLKAGEMKMSYLYELNFSPRTLEMCGYSLGTSYLGGYTRDLCGLSTRARDVGVCASGSFLSLGERYLFTYNIGIFNGNGYEWEDDDSRKNFSAMLVVSPAKNLRISLGGLLGRYTISKEEERYGDRNRLSAGVWYDDGKYFLKAENVYGKTASLKSNGTFLMTGIWFRKNMALALRGDYFLKDTSEKDSAISKAEVCLSHVLTKNIRYRVQYSHTFNSSPGVKDVDTISLSVSFKFSSVSSRK